MASTTGNQKKTRKITRRTLLKKAGVAGGLATVSGMVPFTFAWRADAAVKGKPIIMGMVAEPDGPMNFVVSGDYFTRFTIRSLLAYDAKNATYDLVPGIAAEMPEILDDGMRYRFKLRKNAYYHDGTQIDAEAIVYTIAMQIDPNHPQHNLYKGKWQSLGRLSTIKKAEAVDKFTLDIHMKRFNAAQLHWFTGTGCAGLPVKILQGKNPDLATTDYGAGPYTVVSRQKGVATIMDRFAKFYDPDEGITPKLGFKPITEMNARMAALESGEIDWMDNLTVEGAKYLRGVKNVNVAERKTLYVWFITLDMRKKPFDDIRVRRALNYALDKKALIRDVLGGAAERSYSPLSKQFGDFYAGDQVVHYDYDPDKAKALLKEAGYPDGFKSTIYTNTGRRGQIKPVEMSQFIQANWKAVGVDCDIQAIEWGAFEARRRKGEFAIATRGWTPSTADPDGVLYQNFYSKMVPPTQRNVCYLQDPQVDKWLDAGMQTIDHKARVHAFIEAQKRIVELAPWVFVCHEITFEAYSKDLVGYKVHPDGYGYAMSYAYKE